MKMKIPLIGIYKFTSPINKVYIGQSVNIYKRLSRYKTLKLLQPKIVNSFIEFGFENHKFEIIEEVDVSKLDERELYWKEYYVELLGWGNVLFHHLKDGKGGYKSEETKQRMRKPKHSNEFKERYSKKVIQYTLDGTFIKEWVSIAEATRSVNKISLTNISSCCRGVIKTAYGYIWKFKS